MADVGGAVTARSAGLAVASVVAALALFEAWADPSQPVIHGDATRVLATAVVAAAAWIASTIGLGWGASRRLLSVLGEGSWLDHAVLGHVIGGTALLAVTGAGAFHPGWVVGLTVAGLAAWAASRPWRAVGGVELGSGWVLVAVVGALLGLRAVAPPIDTDEQYWQLAVVAKMVRTGVLPGGWLDPVSSRPLPAQLDFLALTVLGDLPRQLWGGVPAGFAAAKLAHLASALAMVAGISGVVRRHASGAAGREGGALAAALVMLSWSFLEDAPLAHDNLPAAVCVLAALDAALSGRLGRLAVAAGAAVAIKYTAGPVVVGVVLVGAWQAGWRAGVAGLAGMGALIAPWWLRNVVAGLHPMFPYAGWPTDTGLQYVFPEKYGLGHGVNDFLALPFQLVFRARTDDFQFLGRIHPAWLPAGVAVAWVAAWDRRVRVVAAAVLIGLIGWFLGIQWIRHLLPVAPVAAVGAGLALARVTPEVRRVGWVLLVAAAPLQTLTMVERAADAVPVVSGAVSREVWAADRLPATAAVDWIAAHTPADATVAVLFHSDLVSIPRRTVLGSVEDHTPSRWLAVTYGDRAIVHLREQGVQYVLFQRVKFVRKAYPFLGDDAFRRQLDAPVQVIDAALRKDATLVFEQGRWSVWDIAG